MKIQDIRHADGSHKSLRAHRVAYLVEHGELEGIIDTQYELRVPYREAAVGV